MEPVIDIEVPRGFDVVLEGGEVLRGDLTLRDHARAVVLFAHGSGSGRNSPRNRAVARRLNAAGYSTLLLDLVGPQEGDLALSVLARRLLCAARALANEPATRGLPCAFFGGSTGAAVAFTAAASRPPGLCAVVARGGRPDLVPAEQLARVEAPTLFLVGSMDPDVLALNRRAARAMSAQGKVSVIEGASHLFEEPGTLETVAEQTLCFLDDVLRGDTHAEPTVSIEGERRRDDESGSYPWPHSSALFHDRRDAGAQLARRLAAWRGTGALVLAVPRGGVPVAAELARQLALPLDVVVARKLGAPRREELAIGAVTADGTRVVNTELLRALGVTTDYLERETRVQRAEAARRERLFRAGRPPLDLTGREVLVVDDGLATGATVRAVVKALRSANVKRLSVAVPVGEPKACAALTHDVDGLLCLHQPASFYAVASYYEKFPQTTDEEVTRLLGEAHQTAVRT